MSRLGYCSSPGLRQCHLHLHFTRSGCLPVSCTCTGSCRRASSSIVPPPKWLLSSGEWLLWCQLHLSVQ
eukprot:SM001451S01065  [mRNA]  locus=s1451:1224:1430:- [translate_table: standard]